MNKLLLISILGFTLFIYCGSSSRMIRTAGVSPPDTSRITLAITDFKNVTKPQQPLMTVLAGELSEKLSDFPNLTLLERRDIERILTEIGLSLAGLGDAGQADRLGKLLGADYLVLGSFISGKDWLRVQARLVRVESSETILVANIQGKNKMNVEMMKKLAKEISDGFRKYLQKN